MSKETFQISYDGEALSSGTMNVYELAPALLSVGDLVKSTNELLNGDRSSVAVLVESDFKKGSFEIALVLDQNLIEQVKNVLPGHETVGAAGLVALLFGAVKHGEAVVSSVLKLWKLLSGEKPKQIITSTENGTTIVVDGNDNQIIVLPEVGRVYQDSRTRRALDQVLKPVGKVGISQFEVRKNKEVLEHLDKADLPKRILEALELTDEEERDITASTRDTLLTITKPNFTKGKWGFSDGSGKIGATMEDQEFSDRVANQEESFVSGDILKVRLRTEQYIELDGKLKIAHYIEQRADIAGRL